MKSFLSQVFNEKFTHLCDLSDFLIFFVLNWKFPEHKIFTFVLGDARYS